MLACRVMQAAELIVDGLQAFGIEFDSVLVVAQRRQGLVDLDAGRFQQFARLAEARVQARKIVEDVRSAPNDLLNRLFLITEHRDHLVAVFQQLFGMREARLFFLE